MAVSVGNASRSETWGSPFQPHTARPLNINDIDYHSNYRKIFRHLRRHPGDTVTMRNILNTAPLHRWCLALSLASALAIPQLSQAASRIAVLDPGHAEIIVALGAEEQLVLVPQDPTLARGLQGVERFHRQPSIEGLLAHDPDLLIGGNPQRDANVMEQAERLSIPHVMLERTLPAVERVERLAALIGQPERGQALVTRIQAGYASAEALSETGGTPRLLHISSAGAGTSGTVTGAGAATSADALIRRAGAINVGAEAGLDRYQTLSAEGVMAMAPDAVLVSELELAALGGKQGVWTKVPGLVRTPAAREQRLIVLDHAAIKFDGASSGLATHSLAEALYAP